KVDDPGSKAAPNPGYDPNLLTATSAWDVWPGLTDQLDTPLDPISGTGCEDPAAPARPEVLQVSSPVVPASGSRQITVQADFIGGVSSVNGITLHVMGTNGTGTNAVIYTPNVVNVPPPAFTGPNAHALQNAIDSAPAGSLLVLSQGTYNENVLVWKPL